MSAIQSSIGLITGIPIQDTVDQLIAISARPRDQLEFRTQGLVSEQAAVDQLASLVLGLQFSLNKFSATGTFDARTATSSNDAAVGVSVATGASPSAGSYQVTPLQTAAAHQLVSGSFADISDVIGGGALRFRFGGQVDSGIALSELNDGAGVTPGEIKITDRSGATAVVDLRAAQSVDDVLLAINSATDISVSASTDGDTFTLTDNSGGGGSLSVQDIGLGATAAGLGLGGLSTTSQTLTGADVFQLSANTPLDSLNDGGGVRITDDLTDVDDLSITLRDGTTGGVDLSGATTLGDVIDAINNDADFGGNLVAAISGDGNALTLTDSSGGSTNNFVVANGVLGSSADDLGIVTDSTSTAVTGARLVSGLRDTLIASLNGGKGIALGEIDVTDSDSGSATIDLSSAETLGDIVDLINASGTVQVTAAVNADRGGITITDTAGGSGSLVIANGASGTVADDLGIATTTGLSVDSGTLNRQTVSEATLLSTFNGGGGVTLGDVRVTDSSGATGAVDLNTAGEEAETVGDVIDRINALGIGVTASINDTGDGILLTDTAAGSGTLTVAEVGSGVAAADLNLLGASTTTNGGGQQIIDGTTSYSVDLTDLEQSAESISLSSLNNGSGVDLGIFNVVASDGTNFAVDLGAAGNEAFTVGDVIDRINTAATTAGIDVVASVDTAGTGILLTDNTTGEGELTVDDLGSDTAAADLNLIRTAADTDDAQINGAGLFTANDSEQGALATLSQRINDLGAGVTAAVLSDAGGFRLSLTADQAGVANELLIDASSTGLSFVETSRPTDAVALLGSGAASGGVAVTSTSNQFNGVVDGLNLTLNQATGVAVTIDVTSDNSPVVDAVQDFVNSYNSIRSNLDAVTAFDADAATTGILFGRNEALRVDADLARVISGSFTTGDSLTALGSIGVSLSDDGTLSLNTAELESALNDDSAAVETLLTDETNGLVAKLTSAIDQLATDDNSLLTARSQALQATIEANDQRIFDFNERLNRERDRLLLEFFRLEETIALLQSNLDTIASIQPISILSNNNSSNS